MFKTCDNCKSEIKYYERKCPHCGRAFTTLTRSDFPDDESYENHVKTGRLFFVFMFIGIFISLDSFSSCILSPSPFYPYPVLIHIVNLMLPLEINLMDQFLLILLIIRLLYFLLQLYIQYLLQ